MDKMPSSYLEAFERLCDPKLKKLAYIGRVEISKLYMQSLTCKINIIPIRLNMNNVVGVAIKKNSEFLEFFQF